MPRRAIRPPPAAPPRDATMGFRESAAAHRRGSILLLETTMTPLSHAALAMNYVRSTCQVRSNNFTDDILPEGTTASREFLENRQKGKEHLAKRKGELTPKSGPGRLRSDLNAESKVPEMVAMAESAKTFRVGNCNEQSCLAFAYLVERKVKEVEIFSIFGHDHVFVVVGRTSGQLMAFETWNAEAAVCDPWAKRAYLTKFIPVEFATMYQQTKQQFGVASGNEIDLSQWAGEDEVKGWKFKITT
jgi:hypothetical protein